MKTFWDENRICVCCSETNNILAGVAEFSPFFFVMKRNQFQLTILFVYISEHWRQLRDEMTKLRTESDPSRR
jgi:hypothetical protein